MLDKWCSASGAVCERLGAARGAFLWKMEETARGEETGCWRFGLEKLAGMELFGYNQAWAFVLNYFKISYVVLMWE